jgi:N6-adenosine-specific RNA methylase IME4
MSLPVYSFAYFARYYLRSLNNLTAETTINRKEGEKRPFWTVEELEKLNIGSIVASPCFLFLWTGDGGEGLEIGRRLLKKWGFRRAEDIVWVKTNKDNVYFVI